MTSSQRPSLVSFKPAQATDEANTDPAKKPARVFSAPTNPFALQRGETAAPVAPTSRFSPSFKPAAKPATGESRFASTFTSKTDSPSTTFGSASKESAFKAPTKSSLATTTTGQTGSTFSSRFSSETKTTFGTTTTTTTSFARKEDSPTSRFATTTATAASKAAPTTAFSRQQKTDAKADALISFRPGTNATPAPASAVTPPSPFQKEVQISDAEFVQIRDFIYQQCGIFIAENRKYLVENRLSMRIKELGFKSYSEYYKLLRSETGRKEEINKLFEAVTTNETSFFRNPPQLKIFQEVVLAEVVENCRKIGKKRIRIWSAGCSTGEEPYTLAIILREVLKNEISTWDIKITANDLSESVLAAARRGIYSEYALRTTPPEIVQTYFKKEDNVYHIDPALKRLVNFGQINLNDQDQLKRVEKSQIVFCRNVIIYFDDDMKKRVINAFYDNLENNGMLLIGHSESLHNISRAFQPERHTGTIVYRKIE